ncbi:MAG: 50S ribosomal protein L23 [Candidatus Saccharimonadales bacterium]
MSKHSILKPRLSEKTYAQAANESGSVYVFDVPSDSNKHTVAEMVKVQFETEVVSVRIVNVKGKAKRSVSKGGRRVAKGSNSDRKKAYVTLAKGKTLPFFAAIEEAEEKQEKVAEVVDKKAAKADAKEAKKAEKAAAKAEKKEKK